MTRGSSSIIYKLSNVGKDRLHNFLEQLQKDKSDSDESDTEAKEVIHIYERAEIDKYPVTLTRIFDYIKNL